ncbi:MAG: hypothetical protein Q7K43_03820 [Candidatus Woesearchaeota archaeon]|nr:hypothetical protein [Candidatus Woesearchaeota archaeon]
MTTLRKAKTGELQELFSADPALEKYVSHDKEKILVLKAEPKSMATDPLLQVEISFRKCERVGVFDK